uniref:Uncharacterized protein n=1 Tax=Anguilla anguilla TaxID=7936 RepID=A0A0E9XKD5_ANGAN
MRSVGGKTKNYSLQSNRSQYIIIFKKDTQSHFLRNSGELWRKFRI